MALYHRQLPMKLLLVALGAVLLSSGAPVLAAPLPPIGGNGDPHMTGLQGEKFDWHGYPGESFCMISDSNIQINTHLIGQDGVTYFDAFALLYKIGDSVHEVSFQLNQDVPSDDDANFGIELDGRPLAPDAFTGRSACDNFGPLRVFASPDAGIELSMAEENGFAVVLVVEGLANMTITTDNHDLPTGKHLDWAINWIHATSEVHGVLGQTFQPSRADVIAAAMKVNGPQMQAAEVVEGSDDEYRTSSLLAPDCARSRFGTNPDSPTERVGHVATLRRLLSFVEGTNVFPITIKNAGCASGASAACNFA
ncbi:putative root cap family protein [Klebsormidium nitens]|uniref:Putative root cap family protein n=1 Tax=Klebsormidium nitens TaxID=105231 RepID=A0A1Y1I664_KLENI|nr:putative root cap family protein [Klebsormidium nitens]|eukprot:GAQ84206.1 putative root cap family protein [Klebsormidium nitens]